MFQWWNLSHTQGAWERVRGGKGGSEVTEEVEQEIANKVNFVTAFCSITEFAVQGRFLRDDDGKTRKQTNTASAM